MRPFRIQVHHGPHQPDRQLSLHLKEHLPSVFPFSFSKSSPSLFPSPLESTSRDWLILTSALQLGALSWLLQLEAGPPTSTYLTGRKGSTGGRDHKVGRQEETSPPCTTTSPYSPPFHGLVSKLVPSNSKNEDLILFLTGKQAVAAFHQKYSLQAIVPQIFERKHAIIKTKFCPFWLKN